MILMTILICLAIQRYLGFGQTLHNIRWFDRYAGHMQAFVSKLSFGQGVVGVILLLLPIVIIVGLISLILHNWIFNIFYFLFALIILLYCLDAYDLKQQLVDYFSAYQRDDTQAAYYNGFIFIKEIAAENPPEDSPHLARAITRAIFLHADQRIFVILFWYVLAGPVGALFYYLVNQIVLYSQQPNYELGSFKEGARRIQAVLDWVPVRIIGFTYALAGNFNNAFSYWLRHLKMGLLQSQEFAYNSGLAALELEEADPSQANLEENFSALALINRTLVIWIVIIAVFTLGAWIS